MNGNRFWVNLLESSTLNLKISFRQVIKDWISILFIKSRDTIFRRQTDLFSNLFNYSSPWIRLSINVFSELLHNVVAWYQGFQWVMLTNLSNSWVLIQLLLFGFNSFFNDRFTINICQFFLSWTSVNKRLKFFSDRGTQIFNRSSGNS